MNSRYAKDKVHFVFVKERLTGCGLMLFRKKRITKRDGESPWYSGNRLMKISVNLTHVTCITCLIRQRAQFSEVDLVRSHFNAIAMGHKV